MDGQMIFDENGEYKFEQKPPIKGFPELHWTGKRPFKSTMYFPAQLKESYGTDKDGWMNKIFWGDNLQVMSHMLKEFRGKIDLIYIDPPFDSKTNYTKNIKVKNKSLTNDITAFEEKQYGDIWTNDEYIQFIYERVIIIKELLSSKGTLYLHCDWHKSHYLRSVLDEVFGQDNCHNVITWKRSHAQGNAGQGSEHFGIVTDTIFVYSKTGKPIWNQQYIPYSDEIIQRDYKYVDEKTSERYRLAPVDGPGGASKGNPYYEFLGVSGYWRYSEKTMQELYENGEIVLSSTGKSLSRKRYLKDAKGTPVTDLWDDLNRVSPTSSERLDYPTQKPESLLERIISTSSNPESIVFDCFNTEQFIEDLFLVDIRFDLSIECNVSQKGWRPSLLSVLLKTGLLRKNKNLDFYIESTDCPKPYDIYWKVRNVGKVAEEKNCIRGQIYKTNDTHQHEHTDFQGEHFVECYLVKK